MSRLVAVAVVLSISYAASIARAAEGADAKASVVSGGGGCEDPNAKSPEIHSVFGDAATVLSKTDSLKIDLSKRKTFVIILETDESAQATLYERMGEGKVRSTAWNGKSAEQLRMDVERAIMSNKQVNCIGEQSKSIFEKHAKDQQKKAESDAPANVKAAVNHPLQGLKDKFARLTIIILC